MDGCNAQCAGDKLCQLSTVLPGIKSSDPVVPVPVSFRCRQGRAIHYRLQISAHAESPRKGSRPPARCDKETRSSSDPLVHARVSGCAGSVRSEEHTSELQSL